MSMIFFVFYSRLKYAEDVYVDLLRVDPHRERAIRLRPRESKALERTSYKTGRLRIRIVTVRRTFCDRFMWEETIIFA